MGAWVVVQSLCQAEYRRRLGCTLAGMPGNRRVEVSKKNNRYFAYR